jgi:cystathionine beta-lyase/cystathionine gamma-synthase
VDYADASDTDAFIAALTPNTRMVWLESPSNPLLRITDAPAIAEAAHRQGALVGIDSTFGTPYFQNPLDWGVDIVMHSTTKYLGGHSDLLGGVLIARDAALRKTLYEIQKVTGAVASPFDAWLTLRGARTLAVRMRAHESNAIQVATYLERHPKALRVHYPGLPSHPHHERARRLMRGFGGMVGFEVAGGETEARRLLQNTRLFILAGSLGGVESIVSYPPLMSHAAMPREERIQRGIVDSYLRLSVGLEDAPDLIADLEQALAAL